MTDTVPVAISVELSEVFSHAHYRRGRELLASEEGLSATEQAMFRLAHFSFTDKASTMAVEHLSAGGKRIRARLALAAAEALGCPRTHVVAWAAAVELLHNGSLVHDDLQDGDQLRRGQPALWAKYGKTQAINAGDLLLMLPLLAIAEVPAKADVRQHLTVALAERAVCTVRGQVEDIDLLSAQRLSPENYAETVRKKTGQLMALPVEGAALIAGLTADRARAIAEGFVDLGLLFQLQDDILDLYGDKGRAMAGSDLYEGKVSALAVAHLTLYPADRAWLIWLLEQNRETTPPSEVIRAIKAFGRPGGALDEVLAQIRRIRQRIATSALLSPEPSLHAVALELADRAVSPIREVIRSRKKD
jgi:geranylgeranyl diphosphate synthase type I